MRRLSRAFVVAALSLVGCASDDAPGEDEGDGEPPPPPPSILTDTPELEVSAAELGEVVLAVADLRPDTRVEVDGQTWLPGGPSPASVVDDQLRISLGGAMVVGSHELALVHTAGSNQLRSDTVTITIVPSSPEELGITMVPGSAGLGDHLVAHGQGAPAAFGLIDAAAQTIRVRASQWLGDGFELELPGLAVSPQGEIAVDLAVVTVDSGRELIVVWRADGGAAVWARAIGVTNLGEPTEEPGDPVRLWSLDDPEQLAALGPHELARIDAVALLDRLAVIAVEARRDAEQLGAGDRLLATRWLSPELDPAATVLLRGSDSASLDLPADARLWTYAGHAAALSVRVGLGFAWLLTLASNGLPRVDEDPGPLASVPIASAWMRSGDGAFGSRHVFSLDARDPADPNAIPRVRMLLLDRFAGDPETAADLVEIVELPAWPTGRPSLDVLDGVPTLTLPMGPEDEVLALRSTGAAPDLVAVPELRCDELALAGPSFDGVGDTLPLACLLAGDLQMGFLGVD